MPVIKFLGCAPADCPEPTYEVKIIQGVWTTPGTVEIDGAGDPWLWLDPGDSTLHPSCDGITHTYAFRDMKVVYRSTETECIAIAEDPLSWDSANAAFCPDWALCRDGSTGTFLEQTVMGGSDANGRFADFLSFVTGQDMDALPWGSLVPCELTAAGELTTEGLTSISPFPLTLWHGHYYWGYARTGFQCYGGSGGATLLGAVDFSAPLVIVRRMAIRLLAPAYVYLTEINNAVNSPPPPPCGEDFVAPGIYPAGTVFAPDFPSGIRGFRFVILPPRAFNSCPE